MTPVAKTEQYGLTETKDRFSALTAQANATGRPFTVLKGGKPWVEVHPLATKREVDITIIPTHRNVAVADLDDLFADYRGDYRPQEDGFASARGHEVM